MTSATDSLRRLVAASTLCGFVGVSAVLAAQAGPGGAPPPVPQGVGQGPGGQQAPRPPDPRVGLKAGMTDAGEAARGMERIASLPKPDNFTSPTGGGGLTFANSDIAFRGTILAQGNFSGFTLYDIADPTKPLLRTSVNCPGGQGDVSVYGHLLFMSVEETRGRIDCGVPPPAVAVAPPAAPVVAQPPTGQGGRGGPPPLAPDPLRFRGIRIFDITNIAAPKQVGAVQTCRGSHTHTLVPDPKDKGNVYVYGQGTSMVRSGEELAGCVNAPGDSNTGLFSIDVIKVPLASPEKAAVVNRPRIFADPDSGAVSGLWQGGNHGSGTQSSGMTNHCHDITAYPAMGLAAGACSGNGILLDISDPVHPIRLDDVIDPSFAYWHSASFNNDGTKVLFTDEWGGGTSPRCRATDPLNWGADAIFTITNKRMRFASYYKIPAAQTDQENCVAHNGSLVPVPGRDIKVQSWYQGGLSVVDFTDASRPVEIAFFDRGPIDATRAVLGGFWSGYWYNGYVYGSEIARGIDIFRLLPTDLLTQNEIDAANLVTFDQLNVQSQPKITWPQQFVVAKAYLDQLVRSKSLTADRATSLTTAMDNLEKMSAGTARRTASTELVALANQLEKDASTASGRDAAKLRACATTIKGRASQLR